MKPTTTALMIVAALVVYLVGGMVFRTPPEPVQTADPDDSVFSVRTMASTAVLYDEDITVRGHSEALRKVDLRAELEGRVIATPVDRGATVKAGDIICELDSTTQKARVAEAEALLRQRLIEKAAAEELQERGVRTTGQLAVAVANADSARAILEQRKRELRVTELRAPFDAYVDSRPADIGAFLQKGQSCAVLMQRDPMLVVADVSEDHVAKLKTGSEAIVALKGLEARTGTLRFIAGIANPSTRGFRVEVVVPNTDTRIREGQTATLTLFLGQQQAHLLEPSTLVLGKSGAVGIRAVDGDGMVRFFPITILNDTPEGIWVAGLPERVDVITVGQAFVEAGERVKAVAGAGR